MRVFKEEQRFTQKWLIAVMVISTIIPIVILTSKMMQSNHGIQWKEYILTISLIIFASFSIFLFKLKTRIDEIGIHYRFLPFHFSNKTIKWTEIKECYTRKYDALSEYGGWGIKGGSLWNKKNGIAYNVKGEIGLQIVLKSDKKILIGTQKQNEIDNTIKNYLSKFDSGTSE
mgnify:CR=1 FL=1